MCYSQRCGVYSAFLSYYVTILRAQFVCLRLNFAMLQMSVCVRHLSCGVKLKHLTYLVNKSFILS